MTTWCLKGVNDYMVLEGVKDYVVFEGDEELHGP